MMRARHAARALIACGFVRWERKLFVDLANLVGAQVFIIVISSSPPAAAARQSIRRALAGRKSILNDK